MTPFYWSMSWCLGWREKIIYYKTTLFLSSTKELCTNSSLLAAASFIPESSSKQMKLQLKSGWCHHKSCNECIASRIIIHSYILINSDAGDSLPQFPVSNGKFTSRRLNALFRRVRMMFHWGDVQRKVAAFETWQCFDRMGRIPQWKIRYAYML